MAQDGLDQRARVVASEIRKLQGDLQRAAKYLDAIARDVDQVRRECNYSALMDMADSLEKVGPQLLDLSDALREATIDRTIIDLLQMVRDLKYRRT